MILSDLVISLVQAFEEFGNPFLYHHAKFGEDRTMRAGYRCENVVFVCLFFITLRVRSTVRSRGA